MVKKEVSQAPKVDINRMRRDRARIGTVRCGRCRTVHGYSLRCPCGNRARTVGIDLDAMHDEWGTWAPDEDEFVPEELDGELCFPTLALEYTIQRFALAAKRDSDLGPIVTYLEGIRQLIAAGREAAVMEFGRKNGPQAWSERFVARNVKPDIAGYLLDVARWFSREVASIGCDVLQGISDEDKLARRSLLSQLRKELFFLGRSSAKDAFGARTREIERSAFETRIYEIARRKGFESTIERATKLPSTVYPVAMMLLEAAIGVDPKDEAWKSALRTSEET